MVSGTKVARMGLLLAAALPSGWTAAQTSAPATRPNKAVMAILDRQERQGRKVKDIKAKVRYEINDTVAEAKQELFGTLEFLRVGEQDVRFRVEFTKRRVDGGRSRRKLELWLYDGEYLIEAKEVAQTVIKHQVRRPGEPPKDLIGVGKGPFPVPFGQRTERILKYYRVSRVDPSEIGRYYRDVGAKPPAKKETRDVLKLVPRAGTPRAKDHKKVLLFIDKKLGLPTRIVIYEARSENILTSDFWDIRINKGLSKSRFHYQPPPTWEIRVEPLDRDGP